ncbi:LapA family protein [Teredinibacter purpureus]|uniref:LapA family protein n=1 Tax=Teredinibacter purpureus TaxID=2731756 RepID=UPI0005F88669|nr:LapA family protein [Teredinibacter purpureus]
MFQKLIGWLRGVFIILWLVAVLVIGAWIGFYNADYTTLNILGFQLPEMTIGFYLCLTFAVGVGLGWFGTWVLAQGKLYSRKRELGKVQKEVGKLRTAQVQET